MTEARITQLAREVLRDGEAEARISGLAREVARGGDGQVRISHLAREAARGGLGQVRVARLVREVLHAVNPEFSPAPAALTIVGFVPVVSSPIAVAPAALTLSGYLPHPSAQVYAPDAAQLMLSGFAPILSQPENPNFDWRATVISQYVDSPTLVRLIENLNDYIDPVANFDAFFNLVWNINTAVGWGLDVWGRIVGVSRVLHVSVGTESFGWEEGGTTDYTGFGQAPFFGGAPVTSNFALSDNAFRTLILAKALANITDGSIPAINQVLLSLFPGRGDCYVADGLDMTLTYTFTFELSPVEQAIVESSGVLPKSTGVAASVSAPP